MRKILSAQQTREADQHTISHEPISSLDLMERASRAFVSRFVALVKPDLKVTIVCGPGNNGGDGLAIARMLKEEGYQVQCYLLEFSNRLSVDCEANLNQLEGVLPVERINSKEQFTLTKGVVIDAVFGSGLNRPVNGFPAEVINIINESKLPVVAVDIPSGLFADEVELTGAIVKARLTITFELPKLTFLIPETGGFVGEWEAVDIGLDQEFLQSQESGFQLIEQSFVAQLMPERPKFGHKGVFGRVQMVAGSLGKMGAALLCGEACLKSGAGLLTLHVPAVGLNVVQTGLKEAMATVDDCEEYVSDVPLMESANVICAGPGLGTHKETAKAMKDLLRASSQPMVLDADALNIIAANPGLMKHVPKGSVLTPHVGEFERIFEKHAHGLGRIETMRKESVTNGLILVLKGAHTAVSSPDGQVYFNTTGNAGMATAGSGDVLAGVITGLMAQGLNGRDAAVAGVFLHGMAGDLAKNKVGKTSLVASNLLSELPEALNNVTITSLF